VKSRGRKGQGRAGFSGIFDEQQTAQDERQPDAKFHEISYCQFMISRLFALSGLAVQVEKQENMFVT
jgi:hypothetical protein